MRTQKITFVQPLLDIHDMYTVNAAVQCVTTGAKRCKNAKRCTNAKNATITMLTYHCAAFAPSPEAPPAPNHNTLLSTFILNHNSKLAATVSTIMTILCAELCGIRIRCEWCRKYSHAQVTVESQIGWNTQLSTAPHKFVWQGNANAQLN